MPAPATITVLKSDHEIPTACSIALSADIISVRATKETETLFKELSFTTDNVIEKLCLLPSLFSPSVQSLNI